MSPVQTAMRAALLVLRSGGSTAIAQRAYEQVLAACGHPGTPIVWRLDHVLAGTTEEDRTLVTMELVGPIVPDLTRVTETIQLAERAAKGRVEPMALEQRLADIERLATPYGRLWRWGCAGIAAGTFARFVGGDPGSIWLAAAGAVAGQMAKAFLGRFAFGPANLVFIAALISASVASIGFRLGLTETIDAALLGSVVHLAPGLALINGFVDVISQEHTIIGAQRIASALAIFLTLDVAIAMAIVTFN